MIKKSLPVCRNNFEQELKLKLACDLFSLLFAASIISNELQLIDLEKHDNNDIWFCSQSLRYKTYRVSQIKCRWWFKSHFET